jgi:hypothetical protein
MTERRIELPIDRELRSLARRYTEAPPLGLAPKSPAHVNAEQALRNACAMLRLAEERWTTATVRVKRLFCVTLFRGGCRALSSASHEQDVHSRTIPARPSR